MEKSIKVSRSVYFLAYTTIIIITHSLTHGVEPFLRRSSLCSFLQPPVTSSLFGPNILLSTLFSNTLSLCSSLNVRDQVSHPYRNDNNDNNNKNGGGKEESVAVPYQSCTVAYRVPEGRGFGYMLPPRSSGAR
jgi:hypothetical protein